MGSLLPGRPLRILYAAMRWDYGLPERGPSFEHQNFFASLVEWRGTAALRHFDFVALAQRFGVERMSAMLEDEVQQFAPDVLLGVWFDEARDPARETVRRIGRTTPCTTIGWFCDSHWRYQSFDRPWADHLDFVVTTSLAAYERSREDGLGEKVIRSQWGAAPGYRRYPRVKKDIDVSFVGQPHGDRRAVIERLRKAGISVATFGTGWERRLTFEEMVGVFNRSRINLNLSNSHDSKVAQIKARVFEVPACGGFLLTGAAEDLSSYYRPGRELEVFETTKELAGKVRHFLADGKARERIARAGWRRTLSEHTYARRFEDVFARARLWPAPVAAPVVGATASIHGRATAGRRPGVSIVVCTHNDSRFLRASLPGCLDQAVEKEVIVVDDASSEPLDPEVRQYVEANRLTYVRHRKNQGISAARNTGIARAQHDLIVTLDADDFFYPGALDALVAGLSDADVAYGNITDAGNLCFPVTGPLSREHFVSANPLFCSSLFRKRLWSALGGYRVRVGPHYEDWNFWARAFAAGFRFQYVPVTVFNHTTRAGSMLRVLDPRGPDYRKIAVEGVFEA